MTFSFKKTYVKYTGRMYVAGNSCRRRIYFIIQKVRVEDMRIKKMDIHPMHKFKR